MTLSLSPHPGTKADTLKARLKRIPFLRRPLLKVISVISPGIRIPFRTSRQYWEDLYAAGGNSGPGSYHESAEFKASFLNNFVRENAIGSVIEWGCGDGAQLKRAEYPTYIGIDVSRTVIELCRNAFAGDRRKKFFLSIEKPNTRRRAELALSLDVIYHLVEDDVYQSYMADLFESSSRFVAIYAWDVERDSSPNGGHVRHRAFLRWARANAKNWILVNEVNGAPEFGNFYLFELRP